MYEEEAQARGLLPRKIQEPVMNKRREPSRNKRA
jgi:hypothetical protein